MSGLSYLAYTDVGNRSSVRMQGNLATTTQTVLQILQESTLTVDVPTQVAPNDVTSSSLIQSILTMSSQ